MKTKSTIGAILIIISLLLCFEWYDWKLSIILCLAFFGTELKDDLIKFKDDE